MGQRIYDEKLNGEYYSYPNLVCAAIKAKKYATGLRYWELHARLENYTVPVHLELIKEYVCLLMGISTRHFYRVVREGNGIFWEISRYTYDENVRTIRCFSPAEVAASLGVEHPGKRIEADLSDLTSRYYMARQYALLRRWFGSSLASPITRKIVEDVTGIKKRSQKYYRNLLKVEERPNYLVVGVYDTDAEAMEDFLTKGYQNGLYKQYTVDAYHNFKPTLRANTILRRLGNCFPGSDYNRRSEKIAYLGEANGVGIWIERALCHTLPPRYSSSLKFMLTRELGAKSTADSPGFFDRMDTPTYVFYYLWLVQELWERFIDDPWYLERPIYSGYFGPSGKFNRLKRKTRSPSYSF